jgi:predicted enzyme related to lactoylglutathione lyase
MSTNVKPVTWFEIGSADTAATQAFYGRLFGWTFAGDDDSGMDYTMISAGDGIKGGIFGTHGEIPSYAIFYVEVPDVATTCREADEAGGKVLVSRPRPQTVWCLPRSSTRSAIISAFTRPHRQ